MIMDSEFTFPQISLIILPMLVVFIIFYFMSAAEEQLNRTKESIKSSQNKLNDLTLKQKMIDQMVLSEIMNRHRYSIIASVLRHSSSQDLQGLQQNMELVDVSPPQHNLYYSNFQSYNVFFAKIYQPSGSAFGISGNSCTSALNNNNGKELDTSLQNYGVCGGSLRTENKVSQNRKSPERSNNALSDNQNGMNIQLGKNEQRKSSTTVGGYAVLTSKHESSEQSLLIREGLSRISVLETVKKCVQRKVVIRSTKIMRGKKSELDMKLKFVFMANLINFNESKNSRTSHDLRHNGKTLAAIENLENRISLDSKSFRYKLTQVINSSCIIAFNLPIKYKKEFIVFKFIFGLIFKHYNTSWQRFKGKKKIRVRSAIRLSSSPSSQEIATIKYKKNENKRLNLFTDSNMSSGAYPNPYHVPQEKLKQSLAIGDCNIMTEYCTNNHSCRKHFDSQQEGFEPNFTPANTLNIDKNIVQFLANEYNEKEIFNLLNHYIIDQNYSPINSALDKSNHVSKYSPSQNYKITLQKVLSTISEHPTEEDLNAKGRGSLQEIKITIENDPETKLLNCKSVSCIYKCQNQFESSDEDDSIVDFQTHPTFSLSSQLMRNKPPMLSFGNNLYSRYSDSGVVNTKDNVSHTSPNNNEV